MSSFLFAFFLISYGPTCKSPRKFHTFIVFNKFVSACQLLKAFSPFIINQQKDVQGCRIIDLCTTRGSFASFILSFVGDNRCWSNKSANICAGDPCNDNMGSLNRLPVPDSPTPNAQWNEQNCRARSGTAERMSGPPHSSS